MRLVKIIATGLFLATGLMPPLAHSAQNDYEIDLKDLGPAKAGLKPQQQPQTQPSQSATGEIDLKELRKIAPPQPAKPAHRTPVATDPEPAKATGSRQESIHVVQPGEHLFLILMKHYGLSNSAAERLIPEVMSLNGISSPKGLKVGQRLRIPLPAKADRRSASRAAPTTGPPAPAPVADKISTPTQASTQAKTPVQVPATPPIPKPVASPVTGNTISIAPASPCKLARDLVEKMGLLEKRPTRIRGIETVGAAHGERIIVVACKLSRAQQDKIERLLAKSGKQLMVFDEDESAETVVEEIANSLELEFQKSVTKDGEQQPAYIFAPYGVRTEELQLTIIPHDSPPETVTPQKAED